VLGFSGVKVMGGCAAGAPDVTITRPSGAAIRDDESLLVIVTNFVATGGDGILAPVIPAAGFAIDDAAPLARDVFAAYLSRMKGPLREAPLIEAGSRLLDSDCGR
jgi:hypothetical protein